MFEYTYECHQNFRELLKTIQKLLQKIGSFLDLKHLCRRVKNKKLLSAQFYMGPGNFAPNLGSDTAPFSLPMCRFQSTQNQIFKRGLTETISAMHLLVFPLSSLIVIGLSSLIRSNAAGQSNYKTG